MNRRILLGGVLTLLVFSAGCSGRRGLERRVISAWRWPLDDPRIELKEIIENRSDSGGFWRRIAGAPAPAIFSRPYGVAWDGDALVVTDPGAGRVVRLDRFGRVATTKPGLVSGPIGVAACPGGIVISDSRRGEVLLLNHELKLIRRLADELHRPTGVACSRDGVFVAETGRHRILQLPIAPSLEPSEPQSLGRRGNGEGEFNFPSALAAEGEDLWVGDTLNFRVQRLALSGEFLAAFGALGDAPGEMPRIKGLGVDSMGQLWISDGQTDYIALYRKDGTFLMSFGSSGSGVGQFSFPAGIAAHSDGRLAIVDSLNRRVVVFRLVEEKAVGGV